MTWRGDSREPSAIEWAERGAELIDTDPDAAEECYRRALALDDLLSQAWFDLALIHKRRGAWTTCLEYNRRAGELVPEDERDGEPAFWNAGIAATALEDWAAAREAWTIYGIPIEPGDGPIEADFGNAVVRLPIGETVWGRRIDPARMVLLSIPLPDSSYRCGDIVLHDGVPNGARVANGHEFPVFDVLMRWRAAPNPTVQITAWADELAIAALETRLEDACLPHENWTRSVRALCKTCSEGRVDTDSSHHHHGDDDDDGSTTLACSGDIEVVDQLVAEWADDLYVDDYDVVEVA